MKRYVATDRIAWGKNHLNPGEELLDPKPENEKVLLDVLIKTNRVREMAANKSAAGTYRRRDLTAETPRVELKPEPKEVKVEEVKADESERPRRGRIGSMTTSNQPSITPDKD